LTVSVQAPWKRPRESFEEKMQPVKRARRGTNRIR